MTKDEVAQIILRELRVYERGQPINGEYIATARREYDALYSDLADLAFWDSATVPDNLGRHVAVLCAERMANEFGKSAEFQQQLQFRADGRNNHMSAMARLRDLARQSPNRTADSETEF